MTDPRDARIAELEAERNSLSLRLASLRKWFEDRRAALFSDQVDDLERLLNGRQRVGYYCHRCKTQHITTDRPGECLCGSPDIEQLYDPVVEKACVHEWVEGVAFGGASYCRKCDAIKAGAVEKHESLVDRMAPKIEEGMRAVGAKAKQIFEEEMFKPQPGVERPVQIRRFVDCGHEISGPDLDELATVCVICHPQGRPSE